MENQENRDWDKDNFPTSARPVFKGLGLLVLLVLAMCAVVYFLSEHPESEKKLEKQAQIKEQFSPDDSSEELEDEPILPEVEEE